jgi:hypothetical protein
MLIGAGHIGNGKNLADERQPVLAENEFTKPTRSVRRHIDYVKQWRERNLVASIYSPGQRIRSLRRTWMRFTRAIV